MSTDASVPARGTMFRGAQGDAQNTLISVALSIGATLDGVPDGTVDGAFKRTGLTRSMVPGVLDRHRPLMRTAIDGSSVLSINSTLPHSLWLPVLIVTNRPRETPETPRTIPGGVWCILITPAAQKVATDAFNGFLGLPVTQKSGMWHWRRSQRPIWGRELAPSRLQPPTEGPDGIRPAAGSPTTPRGCRRDHACAGGMVQRELGESGGGAGRPVGSDPTPIPALHSCPHGRHRVRRNQDRTTQPTFKARLPVCDFQFAC